MVSRSVAIDPLQDYSFSYVMLIPSWEKHPESPLLLIVPDIALAWKTAPQDILVCEGVTLDRIPLTRWRPIDCTGPS